MLSVFDRSDGTRITADLVRSQEFITAEAPDCTSQGVVELNDGTVRRVRVHRTPDRHGNCRTAQLLPDTGFDAAVEALKTELGGLITEVMPAFKKGERSK